jgi:hypothetical protein
VLAPPGIFVATWPSGGGVMLVTTPKSNNCMVTRPPVSSSAAGMTESSASAVNWRSLPWAVTDSRVRGRGGVPASSTDQGEALRR